MFKAVILAAGKGTRMNSDIPKVLNKINGKALIQYVIDATENIVDEIIITVGFKKEEVMEQINDNVVYAKQEQLLGTGHAVMQAVEHIGDSDDVIVLCGDAPFIKPETIKKIQEVHLCEENAVTILTTIIDNPASYGRIIRDDAGNVVGIVERKDANKEQILIHEINSGVYCFNGKYLKTALTRLENKNSQNEYYLTDTVKIMCDEGLKVGSVTAQDYKEVLGVNTLEELRVAEKIIKGAE